MKKFVPFVLSCLMVVSGALVNTVSGQAASTYVYTYSTPTYAAINGTVLVSGSGSWDAGMVFTNVPLGFTFYFEGQPYDSIGVSSNGFIWFGPGTVSTTEYNPISDATLGTGTINGVVAGYGTQLEAFATANLTSAPTGAPSIMYTTAGTGCSKVFTVQWKGAFAASDPGSQGGFGDLERVDLQIVLDEGTNAISILLHVNPYPYLGSSSGEVGIRGASNTDFTSLTCWTAGCSQTANNAAMGTLDPNYPATKSEFTFTPPVCAYSATTTGVDPTCGANGSVTITPTGVGPYSYIIGNGSGADSNSTGLFTGLGANTYTTLVTNGTCAVSSCTTLTGSSLSTPTASNTGPVCVGGSVTLSTSTVARATYSWTGPNGFTSSNQNPVISDFLAADSGTYTIIDTVGGCASAPGTTHVSISGSSVAPAVGSNSPLCAGATLTLTDSTSGATYSWTGPNSFSSSLQDPTRVGVTTADSGTYTVVDTVSGCVSLPATLHVTVTAPPAAPAVGSNSPLCAGATLTLTDSASGASYSWTGPNTYSSIQQDPSISNVTVGDSGTYSVINTVAGCASLPATVDVVVNPTPVTTASNNGPLCTGNTLQLSATAVSGATYAWTGPNNFSTQNPSITTTTIGDSGVYTVVATVGSCSSAPATTDVVITPPPATPVASNNGPVCEGDTLTLTATGNNAATYTWTGPVNFNTQNPVLINTSLSDSGTYMVFATIGSCVSDTASTNVVVNPSPASPLVSNNGPLCQGSVLQLTAGTVSGASYTWTGPNDFNIQNPSIATTAVTDSGAYTLVVTVNGCSSQPVTTDVFITPTPATPSASNNGPLCTGQTLNLTASGDPSLTYTWTGPNNFSVQDPSILSVALTDSGVYSVFASSSGCNGDTVTTDVVIGLTPATPSATSNGPLCAGDTLMLFATTIPGATYSWSGPVSFNQQNPVLDVTMLADSGTYTVVAAIGTCSSAPSLTDAVIVNAPALPVVTNNGPVCLGGTLLLTATSTPGVNYIWMGPNDFDIQNPSINSVAFTDSGIYSVVATAGSCSSAPATTDVVVIPVPAAPTASNNGPLCVGDTLQLTASNIAGASYSWTGPESFDVQNPQFADVAITDSGIYTVVVTVGTCSSGLATTDVVINPIPAAPAVSNNGPVCPGDTLTFTAGNVSGATYTWTGPGALSGQNPQIDGATPADSGSYSLVITVSGCNSAAVSSNAVVYPAPPTPVISANDTSICSNDSARICVQGTYTSYFWNTGDSTSCIYTNQAGGYYMTITDANGCSAFSNRVNINILPVPTVAISQRGDTLQALDEIAYQWYFNDSLIPNADSSILVITSFGQYAVMVTDSQGCTALSSPINITGIANLINGADFEIYPNPATDKLTVNINNAIKGETQLQIFDMTGRLLVEMPATPGMHAEIDLSDLASGAYVLKLNNGVKQFIKE